MTSISEKLMSNILHGPPASAGGRRLEPEICLDSDGCRYGPASGFYLRFFLDFGIDDTAVGLMWWRRQLFFLGVFHTFPEAFHCAAQITAEIAELLGAEYQNDDNQYDQPVPDTEC